MFYRYCKVFALLIVIIPQLTLICHGQSFFDESSKIAFTFYHHFMSPVKEPVSKCQFNPSCSNFSHAAINEYGFLIGILLTSDRFMRCSGGNLSRHTYPKYNSLLYDPPEKNYIFGEGNIWTAGIYNRRSESNGLLKTVETDFGFAKSLYDAQEYQFSIIELKRIRYNSKDKKLIKKVDLLESINHLCNHDIKSARLSIDRIEFDPYDSLDYCSAIISFVVNDIDKANLWNLNFANFMSNHFANFSKLNEKFSMYSLLKNDKFVELKNSIIASEYINKDTTTLNLHLNFLENITKMKGKSTALAGTLSAILPGSGYVYAGQLKEGLSAFLINALLGIGVYSLLKNENYSGGILASLISLPFYLGNIVGSVNAVHLRNNIIKERVYHEYRHLLGIQYFFSTDFFNSLWYYKID